MTLTKQIRNKALASSAVVLSLLTISPAAFSQNMVQRHPTMAGIGAGVVTHHMLKKSAAYKKAHHQKLNFAERHPTMSAIGAGVATHHVIKMTTHHTMMTHHPVMTHH